MHGLIFMTWEKYLAERFGNDFLQRYRDSIGESTATLPLANRLYDDATLLAGVGAASQLSHFPPDTLLQEYGWYFITNWLTSHLCMYILTSVESARDLLLTMRDAHARLRRTNDSLQPPLFEYRSISADGVVLVYDSPRQLCRVLLGAIQGAAERYGETVQIQELSCMKQGAAVCQFKAHFTPPESDPMRYSRPKRGVKPNEHLVLLRQIWTTLPEAGTIDGFTLGELQERLWRYKGVNEHQLRPAVLLEAVQQLQFAGYVMSTAGTEGDSLIDRRYWHVHRHM
jgi:hypothetical protein